jgi:pyruvate/2-oxoglutarate dehydrogenase complex dihydrolipoamide acyltransferase (E2) component
MAIRQMLTLTLVFDHRVIDGVLAAKFLQRVKQLLEAPEKLVS